MELTKKQLNALIECAIRKKLMQLQEAQAFSDPLVQAFDKMLASIEQVGSLISADDPVFNHIENLMLAAEDAYEAYVGTGD
jgi:hypothetical protein